MKASDSNLKIFKGGQLLWDLLLVGFFSLTLFCLSHSSPVIADFPYLLNE